MGKIIAVDPIRHNSFEIESLSKNKEVTVKIFKESAYRYARDEFYGYIQSISEFCIMPISIPIECKRELSNGNILIEKLMLFISDIEKIEILV